MRRWIRWRMSRPQFQNYWVTYEVGDVRTTYWDQPAYEAAMQNWRGRKPGRGRHTR